MVVDERPFQPPWTTRITSSVTVGAVGSICWGFLYALNRTEVHGLEGFLNILDSRRATEQRERGLITVSNHLSVLDDPIIWGVLPFKYHWEANNMRYSLGSYDILFKRGGVAVNSFFSYGKTLPTHRIAHSKHGGLFQPTMTQAIRLLSDPHGAPRPDLSQASVDLRLRSFPSTDPFSSAELTYTTNGTDIVPAPSAYPSHRYSWVHIFPEGKIHQHPDKVMRYFKWGIARLILEAEPCPDVLPVWIDGMQDVMSDRRSWPRPIPRPGKDVSVHFGELVDRESVFGGFRERWRELKAKVKGRKGELRSKGGFSDVEEKDVLGELHDDELRYGPEAEQLRIDVTMAVRAEVLKLRQSTGLRDEDPKSGLAETWRVEGSRDKREGEMKDRSVVRDM